MILLQYYNILILELPLDQNTIHGISCRRFISSLDEVDNKSSPDNILPTTLLARLGSKQLRRKTSVFPLTSLHLSNSLLTPMD